MIQLLSTFCCFMSLKLQSSCIEVCSSEFLSVCVFVWVCFLHLKAFHCRLNEPHGPFGAGWKSVTRFVSVCVEKRMISWVWKCIMVWYVQALQRLSSLKQLPPQPCLQPLPSRSPPLQWPNRKLPDPRCSPPSPGCLRSTPPRGPIDPIPQHARIRMHLTFARGTLTRSPCWEGRCLCSRLERVIFSKCGYSQGWT